MKHIPKVTALLVILFLVAQITGLIVVNKYIDHKSTSEIHEIVYEPLPYGLERPEVENQSTSFIYIIVAIFIGTGILLLIVKTKKTVLWKIMFFISVAVTLSVAFSAFLSPFLAGSIALILAILKLYRPNIFVQNISEIFIYGGLAAIFVPMLNLFAAFMLLIAISIYDYIAVFRTKHMVKLAEFQSESKVFAGLFIPYERKQSKVANKTAQSKSVKSSKIITAKKPAAVLGGGDIGFTLIFAGVVMQGLMLKEAFLAGFLKTLIIPVSVAAALLFLLMKGKKDKFYPAMPILSLGCFIGWALGYLFLGF